MVDDLDIRAAQERLHPEASCGRCGSKNDLTSVSGLPYAQHEDFRSLTSDRWYVCGPCKKVI